MRICPECKQRTEERTCPSCHITTVDEALLTGQDLVGRVFVERYEVVELLGRGGMGAVYRARHVAMDSQVALKVLRRETAGDLDAIERFYREARSASRLQHPNTIRVFDFGQSEDGQLFLAMEFLDGRTLRNEMRRVGRMDEGRVLRIAEQVAGALGEAHSKGIVHRDVKPENVFLTEMLGHPDFVKVLDFGVARTMSADSLTRTGLAIGTPAYMSPEQARGEKVDGRSDLYSLGVLMFEMTAGIPPFESSTPMHLMMKHLTESPPRLSEVCPGAISDGFEGLVLRLLAKEPSGRPADARELLDSLSRLHPGASITPSAGRPTVSAGIDSATPRRNGSAAFLGPSETPASPTPTTPMPAFASGHGPGRGPVAAGAPLPADSRMPGPSARSGEPVASIPGDDGTIPTRSTGGRRWPVVGALLAVSGSAVAVAAWIWIGFPSPGPGESVDAGVAIAASPVPAPVSSSPSPPSASDAESPSSVAAASPGPEAPDPSPAVRPAAAVARAMITGSPAGARVVAMPSYSLLGRIPVEIEVPPGAPFKVRILADGYRQEDVVLRHAEVLKHPGVVVTLRRKAGASAGGGWEL